MFKDFDISEFKKNKPPGDNSITTKNEIKELKKIPIREKFVKEMDKPYARKIQILTVLEQRAKVMGKMEQARLAKQAKLTLKKRHGKNK